MWGGWWGARPLLWGFSPVACGAACELEGPGSWGVLLHAQHSPTPPDKTAERRVRTGGNCPRWGASLWGRPPASCPHLLLLCLPRHNLGAPPSQRTPEAASSPGTSGVQLRQVGLWAVCPLAHWTVST